MCTVLLQLTVGAHLEQLAVGKYVVYVGWIDLCDLPVQSRCHVDSRGLRVQTVSCFWSLPVQPWYYVWWSILLRQEHSLALL